MKHLKWTLATYVYNHCTMCNITIYFYNIRIKYLQHTSKTTETYYCNMCFQRNIPLLLGRMEAHQCAVFTGGSGPVALVGGGLVVVEACLGRKASTARATVEAATARLG
jgi:hypothetical protein